MSAKKNAIKKSEHALRTVLPALLRATGDFHAERLAVACERLDFFGAVSIWTRRPKNSHPLIAMTAKLWLARSELVYPGVDERYRRLFIPRVFDALREIHNQEVSQ